MSAPPPDTPTFHPHADLVVADMLAADPHQWEAALRPVLAAGLRWLYDTSQPPQAILQHHGCSLPAPAVNRRLAFVPQGWKGFVVIVLHVNALRWGHGHQKPLLNGLNTFEHDRLAELLTNLGQTVVGRWNGAQGSDSGSIALQQPAHEALQAAVGRYHAGCGTHHTVFCSRDGCTWYSNGYAMVVTPQVDAA